MTVVNNVPPKWYEAWFRTELSDLSLAISLTWIVVFVAEQNWPIVPGEGLQPNIHTNTALGALDLISVARGEWWRFFTNPLLHGGPNHLQWDILALLSVGPIFQALVGRAWFGATFASVALASGAVSLLINPVFPGTIGPMGVVMGILAANFVCGFHFKEKEIRSRVWQASGISLVAALFQTFRPQGFPVDISGHIGGMVSGALVGCAFLLSWPQDRPKPRFELAARIVSCLFALGVIAGFGMVALRYPYYVQKMAETIPPSELRKFNMAHAIARSEEYIVRYPSDPWAHLLHGTYFFERKDYVDAEGEFRTGLKLANDSPFGPLYADHARAMLAIALWHQGRFREAENAAAPSCHSKNSDPLFRQMIKSLQDAHICGG